MKLSALPFEAIVWASGLIALAIYNPLSTTTHFTLCPFTLAGFDWCPGCGLGRSISLLFHGRFMASFYMHPLGVFAVVVLSSRIFQLTKQFINTHYGKSN